MSQTINCSSCGAANQLLDGRKTMFCSFCGSSIQSTLNNNISDIGSSIKIKPEITKRKADKGGELSLVNREIKSLKEITCWFSDNELSEIKKLDLSNNELEHLIEIERFTSVKELDLSNNKIKTLKNISKIKVLEIDLSGNKFEEIEEIPKIYYDRYIKINLSNNKNLKKINQKVFESLNTLTNKIASLSINLSGCPNFDLRCLNDLNLNVIKGVCFITIDKDAELPFELINNGFAKFNNEFMPKIGSTWRFLPVEISQSKTVFNTEKKSIELSAWNWIQLLLPFIITLIAVENYQKPFWLSLGMSLFFSLILWGAIANAGKGQNDVKTGRSFKTDFGTVHEMKKENYHHYDVSNNSTGIVFFHLACLVLIIIKGIFF